MQNLSLRGLHGTMSCEQGLCSANTLLTYSGTHLGLPALPYGPSLRLPQLVSTSPLRGLGATAWTLGGLTLFPSPIQACP